MTDQYCSFSIFLTSENMPTSLRSQIKCCKNFFSIRLGAYAIRQKFLLRYCRHQAVCLNIYWMNLANLYKLMLVISLNNYVYIFVHKYINPYITNRSRLKKITRINSANNHTPRLKRLQPPPSNEHNEQAEMIAKQRNFKKWLFD